MKRTRTIMLISIIIPATLTSCGMFYGQGNTDATKAIETIRTDVKDGDWHKRGSTMTIAGTVETANNEEVTFSYAQFDISGGQVELESIPSSCETDASVTDLENLVNSILNEKLMRNGLTKKTIDTRGTFTIDGYSFDIRTKRTFDENGFRDTTTELDLGQKARFLVTVPAGKTIDFKNSAYMKIFYDKNRNSVSFDYQSIVWDGHVIPFPSSPK